VNDQQTATASTPPSVEREVRYAQLHHVNFLTTRLVEMRDWYTKVLGLEVVFEFPMGAWLTNDRANHRLALTALPGLTPDPEKRFHDRLHHSAFEFESFADLNETYLRLRDEEGIVPQACLDHGMTLSYYYADPDGNFVELQCDLFGDWDRSQAWMREALSFSENPIGAFVDPAKIANAVAEGATLDDVHRRAWDTDDFKVAELPDMGGPPPRPGDPPLPAKW
jgi:catechol 2,3-dioxygenase